MQLSYMSTYLNYCNFLLYNGIVIKYHLSETCKPPYLRVKIIVGIKFYFITLIILLLSVHNHSNVKKYIFWLK